MRETRTREQQRSTTGAAGAQGHEPADDWLGEISDEDWSEGAARQPASRATAVDRYGPPASTGDSWPEQEPDPARPIGPPDAADARRATIERRRYTAGLVLLVLLGLGVGITVLLLRSGDQKEESPVNQPTTTTPIETAPATTPTTTTPSSGSSGTGTTTTPTPTTPPTTSGAFTLPEGTKLRQGEGDPALVRELQQALISAGYDPGAVDGTFGPTTKAAVVAFQEDNGLSADGVVGPETASALNSALAGG